MNDNGSFSPEIPFMDAVWFENVNRRVTRRTVSVAAATRQSLAQACTQSLVRASGALLDLQKPEGYWCGDLLADTTLESDYILLQLWLYPPDSSGWNPPTLERVRKAARSILRRQLPDGGFDIYPGGPADPSASVKGLRGAQAGGPRPRPARR
jgi:squalene-hopene/tetraprenyl-beta-curcumene cyclase